MAWVLAATLVAVGLYFIARRRDVARGEALIMGANLPPGCAALQGVLFIAMAVAFLFWFYSR